ncbi:hypothetical protein [Microbaculum marinum]|uniref:Lipoprotein n=1 Tax=Microbaculum marinum TaxID=1764581 RepID=A0AAW9RSH0_9HYPH
MMNTQKFGAPAIVSLALAGLALAGCNGAQTSAPTSAASMAATTRTGPLRPPQAPNFAAEDICVKAVQQQTNAEDVGVISSQGTQVEMVVMVGYPASGAPWRCVVGPRGNVTAVTYLGSEARL